MSKDIVEVKQGDKQDNFLTMIERLSANPDVDVSKIQQILDMQEQVLNRNAKQAFNAAMAVAQMGMPVVPKETWNDQTKSKYAKLDAVLKKVTPVYTQAGFSLMFYEEDAKNKDDIRICVDIMHAQGHTEKRYIDIPLDDKGMQGTKNKTMPHAKRSSVSYGRNSLICMIFNIATGDDDDGNSAGGSKYITEEQQGIMYDIINGKKVNEKGFLKLIKSPSIDKILAKDYDLAIKQLNLITGGKK